MVDGEIAGVIMYFESKIKKADGSEVKVASFGPLCVTRIFRALWKNLMILQTAFRKCRTNHGFIIENGNRHIGMCVISTESEKPLVTYIWLEEEFRGKGIEEEIAKIEE